MTEHRLSEDEERLVRLLRADLPPTRDPLFRIDVLARRERRQFRRQLAVALMFGPASAVHNLVSSLLARVSQTVSRAFVD